MVALCDGEAQTLWAGKGFQTFHYLSTLGFSYPDLPHVAAELAAAIRKADIVCVPRSGPAAQLPGYGPKLRAAMELWDAIPKPEALIGDSLATFYLMFDCWLLGLLENRRVLIINNQADKVATALMTKTVSPSIAILAPPPWIKVTDAIPVMLDGGQAGSAKALAEVAAIPPERKPDIDLVGAGARAAHLCVTTAEMLSIPVIELGDTLRLMHAPSVPGAWEKIKTWYEAEG